MVRSSIVQIAFIPVFALIAFSLLSGMATARFLGRFSVLVAATCRHRRSPPAMPALHK